MLYEVITPGEQNQLAISPSGDRVVYRAGPGGAQNWLYTRELGQLEAARLEETHGGASPCIRALKRSSKATIWCSIKSSPEQGP